MPFTTKKISGAFPEVAIIRKGALKEKRVKDGREYEVLGKDLNDRFRVVFQPGTDKLAEGFQKIYGTFEPKIIHATLPFYRAMDCWEAWNEAYSAGSLIAKADGDHYIMKKNPRNTKEYLVRDGEPHTPWTVGDVITYEGKRGPVTLKFKTHGRLKLFLPYTIDPEGRYVRMTHFTLKTTSYYDCLNIEGNLQAIQNIADVLNNGNAAGIPLIIYRRPTDIAWNHDDGSASREKKWLVYIEADPEWVADAMLRMKALADGKTINLLPSPEREAPPIVAGSDAPNPAEDDDFDPEIDGEYTDVSPENVSRPTAPANAPSSVKVDADDVKPNVSQDGDTESMVRVATEIGAMVSPLDCDSKGKLFSEMTMPELAGHLTKYAKVIKENPADKTTAEKYKNALAARDRLNGNK